ncbi:MAG: site-2 protease family protein [Patescibacteria group bacterium]|nr:site-2 protease family protein [Patescibacteria group bacterium]
MLNLLMQNPLYFLIYILALLAAITIHEFSHALVADYLGDPTARLSGRLKLDPRVHLDLTGLLFLFFFGFGWGKPVPVDSFNLKNPRRDNALISLAGPMSNFILAIILSLLLKLFNFLPESDLINLATVFFISLISFNLVLGVFNLLPIHPLDGFKIVAGFLPKEKAEEWQQLESYGMIFLLLMIFPIGNSSMVEAVVRPGVNFYLNLLLPTSLKTGGIV